MLSLVRLLHEYGNAPLRLSWYIMNFDRGAMHCSRLKPSSFNPTRQLNWTVEDP